MIGSFQAAYFYAYAEKNLKYALPKAIQILKNKGFVFDVIK